EQGDAPVLEEFVSVGRGIPAQRARSLHRALLAAQRERRDRALEAEVVSRPSFRVARSACEDPQSQTQGHRKRPNSYTASDEDGRCADDASDYGTAGDAVQSVSNCCLIGENAVGSNASTPTSRFFVNDV